MTDLALCIGINRYGHGSDLAGCVNDANDWAAALRSSGLEVITLLDRDATAQNIRAAITEIAGTLRYGQTGVITYSGHGTWLPDAEGDEPDRRDEALCPVDLWDNGVITDDDLFVLFQRRVFGSRLVLISDSCHSGTVNRLAAPLSPPAEGERPARRVRYLPPAAFLEDAPSDTRRVIAGRSRSNALLMSGCADSEYSYDAYFRTAGGWRPNGAFTYAALRAREQLREGATYRDWHTLIRAMLPSTDYPQTPALVANSHQKRWPAP